MAVKANTIEEYINSLPSDRKEVIEKLDHLIAKNIPKGFESCISYGMIGYVVPHSIFPSGYHCDPKLPLPFISLASQKNYISLHHMGLYMSDLEEWFKGEYAKLFKDKLDIGKCCIRFKKMDAIPYELIAELVKKVTVNEWVEYYKDTFNPKTKK